MSRNFVEPLNNHQWLKEDRVFPPYVQSLVILKEQEKRKFGLETHSKVTLLYWVLF
jgi:hypothetical protein